MTLTERQAQLHAYIQTQHQKAAYCNLETLVADLGTDADQIDADLEALLDAKLIEFFVMAVNGADVVMYVPASRTR
jgi:hypothetical protein